jgi:hypothetical protein
VGVRHLPPEWLAARELRALAREDAGEDDRRR